MPDGSNSDIRAGAEGQYFHGLRFLDDVLSLHAQEALKTNVGIEKTH